MLRLLSVDEIFSRLKLLLDILGDSIVNEYYCNVCGTSVSEDDLFCPNCGDAFEKNHSDKFSELEET